MRLEAQASLAGAIRPGETDRETWLLVAPLADDGDGRVGVAAGAVDERHARGVEQEHLADVAARLAAVGAVVRVDGAPVVRGSARGLDRRDELRDGLVGRDDAVVGGAVVVLDLLQGEDVGLAEVVDDRLREPRELGGRVGGGEVLDVVRRDGQVALLLRREHLLALEAALGDRAELGGLQDVAAERLVVERSGGSGGQRGADVGGRARRSARGSSGGRCSERRNPNRWYRRAGSGSGPA
ncbi:hypothetical protein [Streptosporangium vulgare]|uniref:hypothetical protein n=1 Tax=Streptosporangium vulgare TaxID=46190 RepID=UPI0031DFA87C